MKLLTYTTTLFLCLFFWGTLLAQVGDFQWGTGLQRGDAEDLTLDHDNNVLATGSFTQTSDFDPGAGTFTLTATGPFNWAHEGYDCRDRLYRS